jgi:outer membrane protein TolC
MVASLTGCVSYRPAPLSPEVTALQLEQRSLDDPRLRAFVAVVAEADRGAPVSRAAICQAPGAAGVTSSADHPSNDRSWNLATLTLAALYFHPQISIVRARVQVAAAGIRTARAIPNPALSFEELNHTVTAPAGWTISPVINFLIETAGKRAERTQEARAQMRSALDDLTTASWQVRAGVRDGLLAVWTIARHVTLLQQRMGLQDQLVTLLEHRLAVGAASALDVQRERINDQQLHLALLDLQQQAADSRLQLAGAIGVPVTALESVTLSFDGLQQPQAPVDEAALRRAALIGRSDLQARLSDYAAAEAALALEVSHQFPNLTLGPGFQFDSARNRYVLLPQLELPLFNHNQGPIAAALARRQEAAARFAALQLQVMEQIDAATTDYRAATAALQTSDALLHDEEDRAARAGGSFEAGAIDRPALLTAQIERSVAQQAQLDMTLRQRRALGALEDALQHPLYFPQARWDASLRDPMPTLGAAR